ncbi:type II toxin-antitoxin system PemK/MazF family toxin [Clostridium algidicarnis]|uniref:type II toxin-antitoxin system PemK/MazF family toxin n=1 Tax=Clostridium algidicarnis TaxID=37659 RepID=UPI003FD7A984
MMSFDRIKNKRIYTVNFDPVNRPEFDNEHLALVLKKNNDKKTCIVMPLTTKFNGVGANKINLGKISSLPSNLKTVDSYAVYDQVRTVNVNRFKPLREGQAYIDAVINDNLFLKLLDLSTTELLHGLDLDEKIIFHKGQYEKACIAKMVALAYDVLRLENNLGNLTQNDSVDNSCLIAEITSKLNCIKSKISGILSIGIKYTLTSKQISDGVKKILTSIVI